MGAKVTVTLEIEASRVPLLPGAIEYARAGAIPGGGKNNRDFVSDCVGDVSPNTESNLRNNCRSSASAIVVTDP